MGSTASAPLPAQHLECPDQASESYSAGTSAVIANHRQVSAIRQPVRQNLAILSRQRTCRYGQTLGTAQHGACCQQSGTPHPAGCIVHQQLQQLQGKGALLAACCGSEARQSACCRLASAPGAVPGQVAQGRRHRRAAQLGSDKQCEASQRAGHSLQTATFAGLQSLGYRR